MLVKLAIVAVGLLSATAATATVVSVVKKRRQDALSIDSETVAKALSVPRFSKPSASLFTSQGGLFDSMHPDAFSPASKPVATAVKAVSVADAGKGLREPIIAALAEMGLPGPSMVETPLSMMTRRIIGDIKRLDKNPSDATKVNKVASRWLELSEEFLKEPSPAMVAFSRAAFKVGGTLLAALGAGTPVSAIGLQIKRRAASIGDIPDNQVDLLVAILTANYAAELAIKAVEDSALKQNENI